MAFEATMTTAGRTATIALIGQLDTDGDGIFATHVEKASTMDLNELVLDMSALNQLSAAGIRVLAYARQQMDDEVEVIITSPVDHVRDTLHAADFDDSVMIRE